MLAGMYVEHEGRPVQVVSISGPAAGPTWVTVDLTAYVLAPLDGSGHYTVTSPKAVDMPFTPACPVCDLPAGFQACASLGFHQGTTVVDGRRVVNPHWQEGAA